MAARPVAMYYIMVLKPNLRTPLELPILIMPHMMEVSDMATIIILSALKKNGLHPLNKYNLVG